MLRILIPDDFQAEREYIVRVLLGEWLGLAYAVEPGAEPATTITAEDRGELRLPDTFFRLAAGAWLAPASLPAEPLAACDLRQTPLTPKLVDPHLPVLYGAPLANGSYVQVDGQRCALGVDIFGSAFFMLTRYEELVVPTRDARDRVPAATSVALRAGFLDRPIIDEYVELLWAALHRLWPNLTRKPRSYRLLLSHDVDRPFMARSGLVGMARRSAGELLKQRNPKQAALQILAYPYLPGRVSPLDPHDTFDFIQTESEARCLRSAFYFMTYQSPRPVDGDYDLRHPFIRKLIRRIGERGHEVGLHASYDTYLDAKRTSGEARELITTAQGLGVQQTAWGGRQHYLRFRTPDTWQNWEDAGLEYDSTLTFHDGSGFRSGTCHEHPVWNLRTRRTLRLRERPLVVMEGTLFEYQKLDDNSFLDRVQELQRRVKLMDGDFTLLWHNNSLMSAARRRLYQQALDLCA